MTRKNLAIWFLNLMLLDGPVPAQEMISTGKQLGFSKKTLQRAKKEQGIKSIQTFNPQGGIGGWLWLK